MRPIVHGAFYEFCRDEPGREIGQRIPRPHAVLRVRRGQDVYTQSSKDARALAKDIQKGRADWDGAHQENYYPHFHPVGNHQFGHIFYGESGYRQGQNRRA